MNKSDQINELAAALAKAQGKFTPPVKDKTVRTDKYSYRYSDLANTIDAVRGPLSENGLSYTQVLCENPFRLETILMHSSGQWLGSSYQLAQGGTPQQFGSALTYARRYTLNCLLGIAADDDDDGAEAEKGAKNNRQQPTRPAPVIAEDHKPARATQPTTVDPVVQAATNLGGVVRQEPVQKGASKAPTQEQRKEFQALIAQVKSIGQKPCIPPGVPGADEMQDCIDKMRGMLKEFEGVAQPA